jgi:hypothetical protein
LVLGSIHFCSRNTRATLQSNTQYFQYEPATWLQGWLLHSWQTINESSSPASVFANDNIPGPPDSPILPPPAATPPMFTGGMALERQHHLLKTWFADHKDIRPLPTGHVEIFALGRIPDHVYPLEVEEPLTNHVIEQHCFVQDDYYGGYVIDDALLASHLDNWTFYFPPTFTSLVLIPTEEGVLIPISQGDTNTPTQPHDNN